tara:strand:- start:351 stop:647 length:297 start_codon:yes stop_codon:yes gene_type:complete
LNESDFISSKSLSNAFLLSIGSDDFIAKSTKVLISAFDNGGLLEGLSKIDDLLTDEEELSTLPAKPLERTSNAGSVEEEDLDGVDAPIPLMKESETPL